MTIKTWDEQLKVLIELQKIDTQLFHLDKELAEKPKEKKAMEAAFDSRRNALKASEQTLKDLQLRQKERETELLTKEANIQKYQSQQTQVKTNKEYSALTHEINGLKADCSVFEEEILKLMDQIENQKKAVEADKKLTQEEEKKLKADLAVIDARADALKIQIAGLTADRAKYLPDVEKNLLAQYDRMVKKLEGVALAPLLGETCSGCHMTNTYQTINEIRLKEKMLNCETCGRILYEA